MNYWPFTLSPWVHGRKIKENREDREIILDDDSLDRAIRAGVQFPLQWFLEQTPEVQEAIATRKDLWLEDLIVAAGYAILDPERTRLALEAEDGNEEAEQALTSLNAQAVAEVMGRHASQQSHTEAKEPKSYTMSGLGERQREALKKLQRESKKEPFFGAEEVVA
tara:strand:+ start:789 stop:1283 length:495 start_codon:yes stop_codon:yes gene_type:complete